MPELSWTLEYSLERLPSPLPWQLESMARFLLWRRAKPTLPLQGEEVKEAKSEIINMRFQEVLGSSRGGGESGVDDGGGT